MISIPAWDTTARKVAAADNHVGISKVLLHSGGRRLAGLDALRGLAAMAVMVEHYLAVLPAMPAAPVIGVAAGHAFFAGPGPNPFFWWASYTPLRLAWTGAQAVQLFFILSGLVLSLPFYRGKQDVLAFLLRRATRLYPLHLLVLAGAVTAIVALGAAPIPSFSPVLPTANEVLRQAGLFGNFDVNAINPVVWTLVHEVRLSLLLPIILLAMPRSTIIRSLFAVAAVWIGSSLLFHFLSSIAPGEMAWWETLRFLRLFVLGAAIGSHCEQLVASFSAMSIGVRAFLVAGGMLAYAASSYLPTTHWIWALMVAAGSATLIVAAMSPGSYQRFLHLRPLQTLGSASYGIYLIHIPILYVAYSLLAPTWPTGLILGLSVTLTLWLAILLHRWLEVPGIALGRRLGASVPSTRGLQVKARGELRA